MRSARRRRVVSLPEITLTPLIDTALCLLIIFMVTSPMLKDSLGLKLPEVTNKAEKVKPQNKLEVFIDKNQQIQVGKKNIKFENLREEVKKMLIQSMDKTVILNADGVLDYKFIMKVLSEINSIEGEKNVALACKETTNKNKNF